MTDARFWKPCPTVEPSVPVAPVVKEAVVDLEVADAGGEKVLAKIKEDAKPPAAAARALALDYPLDKRIDVITMFFDSILPADLDAMQAQWTAVQVATKTLVPVVVQAEKNDAALVTANKRADDAEKALTDSTHQMLQWFKAGALLLAALGMAFLIVTKGSGWQIGLGAMVVGVATWALFSWVDSNAWWLKPAAGLATLALVIYAVWKAHKDKLGAQAALATTVTGVSAALTGMETAVAEKAKTILQVANTAGGIEAQVRTLIGKPPPGWWTRLKAWWNNTPAQEAKP
jgi:hypothetical protein